jgi:hypothetical protein
MALSLSLTAAAALSYFLLRLSPRKAFEIVLGRKQSRTFKGGALTYPISYTTADGREGTAVDLIHVPEGVQAELRSDEGGGRELVVRSGYAGVFSGFHLRIGIGDHLGLFSRYEERRLALGAEFLPISLLTRQGGMTVSAAMLGDRPAGSKGFGQEFYTAELYDPSHDSKGILWKRQARSEGDTLMVRVGEANIPETLTICLLEHHARSERELPGWMDLASEAISLIGLSALASGSSLRVIHQTGINATASEAKDLKGLADLLGWLWRGDAGKERSTLGPGDAAIIVTGKNEIENPDILGLMLRKPSIVLSYTSGSVAHGANVVFFTGKENINLLVSRVLSR